MPIFDNELIDSSANRDLNPQLPGTPKSYLGSPTIRDVDVSLPTGGVPSGGSFNGLSIAQLSEIGLAARDTRTFGGPMMMVPRKELLDNQRYGTYVRGVDLENIYGIQQPWYSQMGNATAKFFATGIGTFAQGFATIPNTVAAVKNGSFSELSGKDGYESDIDTWLKNLEDTFPNYYSRWEKEHPYRSMIPFMRGSANFWGDKVIKNLGFTAGAIGSALVQDAAVAYVTGGIGEIPLIANQIGKASLYLNKLFTGTNKLDKVLDTARALGKSERFIDNLSDLGRAAAATKLANGFRYGLTLYGSARTEAAVEARDAYRQVRDELINQYKGENGGAEPQGAALSEIENYATDAMNVRFGANMALLTVSNALQFGTLFKSFTNMSKGVPGSIERTLEDAGRIGLTQGSLDVFEKKAISGLGAKVWDAVKPSLKNVLSEGIYEEGGQYAVEKGTYDYYTRKYKNLKDPNNRENWNTLNEALISTNKGLAEQFGSSVGIEQMLIGGISALITGGVTGRIQRAKGEPTKDQRLQSAINIVNRYGLTGIMQDQYSDTLNSAGNAREMQEAASSGNIFKYKNLKHDQFFGFVSSRIPSDLHDVTIEQLNMLKDLDKAEFEKTFGMDFTESNKSTVVEYVDSLIDKANGIKDMYDSVNFTFKNPFKSYLNPTEDEVEENFKYDTYNDWKTNLVYYASVAPDVNNRLNNIQNDLAAINPLLSNDTVSSLTNREGLKEIASQYEEKAKSLGNTITEFTTPADRRAIRDEIKTLRTLSERINLALNKNDLDLKTFETLLNFEMSNQTSITDKAVPVEKIAEVYGLGADVNALIQLRKDASESFDNLASEDGFNKFFDQAEEMAEEQQEESNKEEATPTEEKPLEFVNRAGAKEVPQTDREYQLDGLSLAKVNKIADDRYEVVSPLGESSFYPTKEDADQAAEDMNADIQDLQKVKVLEINEDGTVKVEDLAGNIQNIKPEQMSGYERIQSAQEKLIERKEELIRQQTELEKNSGSVTTIDSSQEFGEKEPPKREVSQLFTGGITESETYNDPTKSAAHVIRSRRFLNNVKNNKNRADVKAILVTPNQEAGLGLTGLAALSYKVDTTKMTEAELKEFNETIRKSDTGFIAQVFVVQKGNKLFFADENGNLMNEVGTQVDLDKVVFQTMPTPALYDSEGKPRFRAGQEAEAKAYSEAWAKYREQLMGAPATAFTIHDFRISRGIAIVNDTPALDEDGNPVLNSQGKPLMTFERNHVGDVLVPEDKTGNKGLIVISVTGEIVHNGLPVNVLRGTPVLQYGDTLQVLNNRTFNKTEAKTIFRLLSELSKGFALNSNLEESYTNFLQNILHWKQGKNPSKNQVYINPDSMDLRIAGKDIPLSEVNEREAEIMEELQKTFSNVNNKTIYSDYPFTEYFIDENDQIDSREWSSYNSYLLSASYPDGSKRAIKDTPLYTSVSKPTTSIPYSYMQKYAVLEGLELDVQYTAPAQQAEAKGELVVDGYVINGETTNIFPLRKEHGSFEFTATQLPNGKFEVELVDSQMTRDTVARIAKNKELVNNEIVPQLKALGVYDPIKDATKTDEDIVGDYVAYIASATLEKKSKEKPAAAPVVETAATVTQTTPYGTEAGPAVTTSTESVSNTEADTQFGEDMLSGLKQLNIDTQKADIERRRQEELEKNNKLRVQDFKTKLAEKFDSLSETRAKLKQEVSDDNSLSEQDKELLTVAIDGIFDIPGSNPFIVDEIKGYAPYNLKTFEEYIKYNFPNLTRKQITDVLSKHVEHFAIEHKGALLATLEGPSGLPSNLAELNAAKINAKYDAELAALEGKPASTPEAPVNLNAELVKTLTEERDQKLSDLMPLYATARKTMMQLGDEALDLGDRNILADPVKYLEGRIAQGEYSLQQSIDRLKALDTNNPDNAKEAKNLQRYIDTEKIVLGKTYPKLEQIKAVVAEYNDKMSRIGETPTPTAQSYDNKGTTGPSTDFRVVAKGEQKEDKMDDLDLAEFKKWHAANVPGIPYEILENIVRRNPDITAWGVFENGVAKFYRSATRGTEYHEVFEGIWKGFLSPGERQDLLNEFRSQAGTFKDRASGRDIEYAAATDTEAKERIADDFADFRVGKLPVRSLGDLIIRFFRSIMNFFKNFNAKPTLKKQLFEAIDLGKFKESVLPDTVKNEAAAYREIEGLSEQQAQKFVEDMTARVAGLVFLKAKKYLYTPQKLTSKQIFGEIEEMYLREGQTPGWNGVNKRTKLGDGRWEALVQRTKEKLRILGVTFNEDGIIKLNGEDTNKNDYAPEAFTVDIKKGASFDVKFTLATLFKAKAMDQSNTLNLEMPDAQIDAEVLGYKLLNFSTAFATLLERLSNTSGVNNMTDKLLELAANDADYVRMFTRLGGKKDKSIPYKDFKAEDWKFFISFTQTFTRQRPDAMVQRVAGGETFTTPANVQTAARQQVDTWVTNMKVLSRTNKGAIVYNSATQTYKANTKKLKDMPIGTSKQMIEFLNEIGVTFDSDTYKKLKSYGGDKSQKNQFAAAVKDIRAFLQDTDDLLTVTGQTLGITTQLNTLGRLYINANNPNQDITYFGIERKRMQAYIDNNTASVFENEFNEATTLDELLEKRPELQDIFSTGAQILKKGGLYFDKDGNRIREIKVMTIQGVENSDESKSKGISKLGLGERFSLEINENLNGNFYILIPADSSTEWMMNVGNQISYQEFADGKAWNKIYSIYKGYLMDDIALARDFKNRGKLNNVNARAKELRFFNDILRPKTLEKLNSMIADKSVSMEEIEKYVNENQESINQDVAAFLEGITDTTFNTLKDNDQIVPIQEGWTWDSLDNTFARKNNINKTKPIIEDVLKQVLLFRTVNYTINNIEYHKIIFGDPLQFSTEKGKFDETKRIKSFLSPRRTTFDVAEFDNFLNDNLNEVAGIALQPPKDDRPADPGYHNHKAYTRTVTFADPKIAGALANIIPAYADIKEADAASWLMDTTFREIKNKNGQWTDEAEDFHQWQMANTRKKLAAKGEYTYASSELKAYDEKLTSTPSPKYTLEILKPIVSGVKYNSNNINLVLDKFSQMPIYYSMVEGTTLEKLYIQMWKQGYGYAIVESGRKVGAEGLHSIYNPNGTFNEEAFNNFVDVPWKAYGIQVENIYDEGKEQTRGSQSTKLISIDLFANGEVFGATGARAEYIKNLYKKNVKDLDRMHANAYNNLLKKLGVVDNGQGFTLEDKQALSEVLVYEMFRRELSENAKDTVRLNEEDEFRIPFEASPSYVQIRNIIYSMVEKAILSPKMGGKPLVQAPVTMWENAEKGRSLVQKTKDGWKKISREEYEALEDSEKKKVRMTSDTLKFYTKDKPYMEVMLPHWFKDKLAAKKFKTDQEILDYINKSPDGAKILRGIGFRIPTQSLSSIDSFKVVGFLPQYMGDTVIVPTELVTKSGSDFDIDKLNTYLRNVYVDATGNLRLVKYNGSEEATKQFFTKVYEDTIQTEIDRIDKFEDFRDRMFSVLIDVEDLTDFSSESVNAAIDEQDVDFFYDNLNLFKEIIKQAADANLPASEYIAQQVEKLADKKTKLTKKIFNEKLKNEFVEDMYKRSLENEYYDSFEELLTLPENFNRLISPVGDGGLKEIATEIEDLLGEKEADVKNKIINPNYMTTLRHAFITAKAWVGIGAVNITNHSLSQKVTVIMDPEKIKNSPAFDQKFLGDGGILLPHNKVTVNGKEYISMSGVLDADGKLYISDGLSGYITSFVDVAKDPYIMKVIRSTKAVGTFMVMQRMGVPIRTAALFMNQPIIRKYLELVEGTGARGLFGRKNMSTIMDRFPVKEGDVAEVADTIDVENLAENIREFAEKGKLSTLKKNAEQQLIFQQFLRLAKMADYNFKFTQAINYDTSKFKSADALSKKVMKTDLAAENNIFTSPTEVLKNSHIGNQKKILGLSVDATGAIFVLDQDRFRAITDKILDQYKQREFIAEDDYDRISNKVRASFLDYVIQTRTGLNASIKPLLIDANTSVATRLAEAKTLYANELPILRQLEVRFNRENGIHTVMLMANVKDAASENMYIGMMRELRNNPKTNQLYKDLVTLSILQGTYQTGVSIKNIIPIEDYSAVVAPVISGLRVTEDMDAFAEGMFQRNNWDDNMVFYPLNEVFFRTLTVDPRYQDIAGEAVYEYFSPVFPNNDALKIKSSQRIILYLDENYDSEAIGSGDYVKIKRVVANKNGGELVDVLKGVGLSKKAYAIMKKAGNPMITQVLGYQKVKYPGTDVPVTVGVKNYKGDIENKYVYKLINLYGEGSFGSEYYTDFKPSVVDNNTVTIKNEIPDSDIVAALSQDIKVDDIMQQSATPTNDVKVDMGRQAEIEPGLGLTKENFEFPEGYDEAMAAAAVTGLSSETKINIYAGTGENAELSNFANRPFILGDDITYPTVEHAFQLEKLQYSNAYTDEQREAIIRDMITKSAAQVKAFGKTIKGLNVKMWNEDASEIMKDLIKQSFQANPAALQKLLATGNAELTHTQDNTKWGKEFPKLLMEVREELRPQAPAKPEATQIDLFDTNDENLDGADESNPCKR